MASNPFDQFDQNKAESNPFDQFDQKQQEQKQEKPREYPHTPPEQSELRLGWGQEKTTLGTPGQLVEFGFDVATAGIGAGGGALIKGLAKTGAEKLMGNALKIAKSGEAATAIRTMLDEGLNVTRGGLNKLRSKIDLLNEEIKSAIAKSPATVNKAKVASALKDVVERFKSQVNPQADLKAIRKSFDEFMNHPDLVGKSEIPIQKAQELKQGTYRALGSKPYGELKGAEVESQKALARGLKEGVSEGAPEVNGLNSKESKLLTALKPVEKQVIAEANRNPGGLVYLFHNPAAATAYLADKSPAVKSILANMINRAGRAAPVAGAAAGVMASQSVPLSEAFKK